MDEFNAAESLWRSLTKSNTQELVNGLRGAPSNLRRYPSVPAADARLPGDDRLTAHLYRSFDATFGTQSYQEMLEAQDRADQAANEADERIARERRLKEREDEDFYESIEPLASDLTRDAIAAEDAGIDRWSEL